MKNTIKLTRFITITAMLTALSVILYTFLEFPILPAAPFLQYDFSDVVAVIGGIFVSPLVGFFIQLLKNSIHLLIKGSTAGIGELANFITGLLFIMPIIFLFKKSKVLAFVIGSLLFMIGAAILNYFVFLPLYGVVGDDRMYYLKVGIIPFNAIKSVLSSISTLLLWKLLLPFKNRLKI